MTSVLSPHPKFSLSFLWRGPLEIPSASIGLIDFCFKGSQDKIIVRLPSEIAGLRAEIKFLTKQNAEKKEFKAARKLVLSTSQLASLKMNMLICKVMENTKSLQIESTSEINYALNANLKEGASYRLVLMYKNGVYNASIEDENFLSWDILCEEFAHHDISNPDFFYGLQKKMALLTEEQRLQLENELKERQKKALESECEGVGRVCECALKLLSTFKQ